MKGVVAFLTIASMPLVASADVSQHKAEAKKITGAFFKELKGELGKGMKAGGPTTAIDKCNLKAPGIALKHSQATGWEVGRTSLKLRNPANAPDDWEEKVLHQFEKRRANGEGPDTLAHAEVVKENGDEYFRFMKGIVMPPANKMPCLKCHGENLNAQVSAKLNRLYPHDKATGYKAGQVRGAFTLKKKL